MKEAILNAASTPQGLIILVVFAFIALTLVITAIFFAVAALVRRKRAAATLNVQAVQNGLSASAAAAAPGASGSSAQANSSLEAAKPAYADAAPERELPSAVETDDALVSNDPLASFVPPPKSRSKAPIGLARLRDEADDFVAPKRREPGLAETQAIEQKEPSFGESAQRTQTAMQAPVRDEPTIAAVAAAAAVSAASHAVNEHAAQAMQSVQPAAPAMPTAPVFTYESSGKAVPIREHAAPPPPVSPLANAVVLLTLPFERRPGLTTAHAELCGMGIEAVFFDPELVARIEDDPIRLVPFLPADMGRILFRESDRETFRAGPLRAQPDAVIELTTGLIALEYKSKGGRPEDPIRWAETMREKDLLQTVVNALVLSAESGRPVAPVLRTHNAVFFLRPGEAVLKLLRENVDSALLFLANSMDGLDRPGISALDYAGLMTVGMSKRFPKPRSAMNDFGETAHKKLLR